MTWKIDSFEPSDGRRIAGDVVDHIAWLKRAGAGETVHIALNISSEGVPADEARAILETMVRGLNDAA